MKPTDNPDHVEGAVQHALLPGGKLVSVHLHRYRLPQQRDEEPQVGGRVQEELDDGNFQDLSHLQKTCNSR